MRLEREGSTLQLVVSVDVMEERGYPAVPASALPTPGHQLVEYTCVPCRSIHYMHVYKYVVMPSTINTCGHSRKPRPGKVYHHSTLTQKLHDKTNEPSHYPERKQAFRHPSVPIRLHQQEHPASPKSTEWYPLSSPSRPQPLLHELRRRQRLYHTRPVAEPRPEDAVRVLEHAVLQTDDDKLRPAEPRLDQPPDVLCV